MTNSELSSLRRISGPPSHTKITQENCCTAKSESCDSRNVMDHTGCLQTIGRKWVIVVHQCAKNILTVESPLAERHDLQIVLRMVSIIPLPCKGKPRAIFPISIGKMLSVLRPSPLPYVYIPKHYLTANIVGGRIRQIDISDMSSIANR